MPSNSNIVKNKEEIKTKIEIPRFIEIMMDRYPFFKHFFSYFLKGLWGNEKSLSVIDSPIYELDINYFPNHSFVELANEIPHLAELGIKMIYLLPIWEPVFDSPDTAYLIKDYYKIWEERYGSKEELKEMIERAHEYGINMLFDFVTSLAYNRSYIVEEHPEWILRGDDGSMQRYYPYPEWRWAIDCTNLEVIEYFTDVACYYIKEYDIDGWRIDSPQNNYNPTKVSGDHSRIKLLRSVKNAITKIKPHAILMAEISGPEFLWKREWEPLFDEMCELSYHYEFCGFMGGNIFSGYHYVLPNGSHVDEFYETMLDKIIHNEASSQQFVNYIKNEKILYNRTRANFIENHDTERVSKAFPKKHRALFVLIATMPGVPVIHAGQEVGKGKRLYYQAGNGYYEDKKLEEFYKRVLEIRANHKALRYGDITNIWNDGDNTIAYMRSYGKEHVIVILNFNSKNAKSKLCIPVDEVGLDKNATYILQDEFTHEEKEYKGVELQNFEISIKGYNYHVFSLEKKD